MLVLSGTLTPLGCLSFLRFLINQPSGFKNTVSLDSPESGSKPMETLVCFFLRRSVKPGGLQGAAPGVGCMSRVRRCPVLPRCFPWSQAERRPPPSKSACWFVSPLHRCTFVCRSERAAWRGPPGLRESQRSVSEGAEL